MEDADQATHQILGRLRINAKFPSLRAEKLESHPLKEVFFAFFLPQRLYHYHPIRKQLSTSLIKPIKYLFFYCQLPYSGLKYNFCIKSNLN